MMSLKRKSPWLVALAILLATAIWAFYYHARLYLNESLYVEQGSYPYKLLISDSIKSLPAFEPIAGSVKYHYSAGDGNKPQSDSLEFDSKEQTKGILTFYSNVLTKKGYRPVQAEYSTDHNVILGSAKETFNIYVDSGANVRQVTIYHLEVADKIR